MAIFGQVCNNMTSSLKIVINSHHHNHRGMENDESGSSTGEKMERL